MFDVEMKAKVLEACPTLNVVITEYKANIKNQFIVKNVNKDFIPNK